MENEFSNERIEDVDETSGSASGSKWKNLNWRTIAVTGAIAVLVIVVAFQSVQIASLQGDSGSVTGAATSSGASVEEIYNDIMPTGTPDYGAEAGVSYDNVEGSLTTLASYARSISLSGADKDRYVKIATTPNTACEYCCGIGDNGFGTSDGRIACGCSHNVAFGGLSKWLIKNTDYSDEEIVNEIQQWKKLFFPKNAVQEEMKSRGVSGGATLPGMVGGC